MASYCLIESDNERDWQYLGASPSYVRNREDEKNNNLSNGVVTSKDGARTSY